MIRRGTRVVAEDGAHGTVLSIDRDCVTVDFEQDETWGQRTRDVDIEGLYREDEYDCE
jgi:preprotein translocase subunit YajC